jgi:hypothetical protein
VSTCGGFLHPTTCPFTHLLAPSRTPAPLPHTCRAEQAKAKEAAALAAAEESGEELTADLRPHAWRFRALGLSLGGDSLEAAEHDIKNAATFDGELAAGGARASAAARVQFANNDTYFGAYAGDVKHGPGVYAFASGAAYAGFYEGGKRAGHGVMVFPDGGALLLLGAPGRALLWGPPRFGSCAAAAPCGRHRQRNPREGGAWAQLARPHAARL